MPQEKSQHKIDPAKPKLDFSILRTLRQQAGLTLEQVSQSSGISVAVISKLERNQNVAELETLYKLARVFALNGAELLALAESPLALRRSAVAYQSGHFRFSRLSFANLDLFFGTATTGASLARPEAHSDDHEICWVLKGRLKLTVNHDEYTLEPGEGLQFDAVQPHGYEALENTELLLIHLRKHQRI